MGREGQLYLLFSFHKCLTSIVLEEALLFLHLHLICHLVFFIVNDKITYITGRGWQAIIRLLEGV